MSEFEIGPEDQFEEDLFYTNRVRELQNEDFLLNTVERIVLKATGCSVVLFYTLGNQTSRSMRAVWTSLSDRFAGVNFMAVNASRRVNIMKAFDDVKNDLDHPLNRFRLRGFPTILVYREGGTQEGISWPQAFYNGELSTSAIQDWILTLACEPGYTEVPTLREGVVDDLNIQVNDPRQPQSQRPLSSLDFQSVDFDVGEAVRGEVIETRQFEDLDVDFAEDERPISQSNVYSFQSTFETGSVDPGFLEDIRDQEFTLDN